MAKEFPLAVVIRGVDRVTGVMSKIQGAVGRFDNAVGAKFRAFGDRLGLPAVTAASKRFGSAIGDLGAKVGQVGLGIAAAFTAASVAAYSMLQSFVDAGSEINDVSTSIGISAETLQEWRYAAKQNGIEAELLDNSLGILSKNLGKAFRGKGPAELLKAMRVSLKGANGQFKTTDQLLPEIANGLAKIKNPALRASAAAELFGRGGVKLLPMLKDGSKGLADFAKRARELGIVISNEAIGQTDDFGDKMDDLKASFTGVRNTIASALMPTLLPLIEQFTKFITDNRGNIESWAKGFARDLPGHLRDLRDGFAELWEKLKPIVDIVGVLVKTFGGSNVTIAAIATAITALLLPSLVAVTSAFWSLNVALWANPIGLVIALIVAIVGALAYFSLKIEDGQIKLTKFGNLLLWLVTSPIDLVMKGFRMMGDLFDSITGWWGKRIEDIGQSFSRLFNMIPDWAKNMLSGGAAIALPGPIGTAAALGARALGAQQQGSVKVQVDLNGLPPGSRVRSDQSGAPAFELNQGYAFEG